ncbi:serum paraoxonase/arylesterase 2-like isoform X2 [Ambystoma mexicanum]|uniref:serum paraoxonase/arylesterase 2-like isoform X2 n=1 Tax=Ambystoma mexicanum TaxID=8296 RepID=UPI0037E842BF
MGKLLVLAVAGILCALIGERIVRLRQEFYVTWEREQVEPSNCQLLKGIEAGSEDIDILPNGLAFISSGLKYPMMPTFAPDKPGEILLLDLNEEDPKPVTLRISRGFDVESFNPHGISKYIDEKDDTVYLFVVNHPKHTTTVEIFKFQEEENALLHLKTVQHELLHSANDVFAVGQDSFYATNDRYFLNDICRSAEAFLGLRWTNVVYYSPEEVKEVASGYQSANGIALSRDHKYVYVADFIDQSIHVLEKHANWSLSPKKVLKVNTFPDNLCIDPTTGDIWSGCQMDVIKFFNYDPENPPGSEVIRVQNILSENPVVTRMYVNNGSVLQGSSVACVHDGRLIVGTVFHKAVYCDLD